jgi:hypothetical protein
VVGIPGFKKRTVLIRGLSGGYYLCDPFMSNGFLDVCPDKGTAAAVMTHQLDMLEQEDSKYENWLLFFPPTVELDPRPLAERETKEDFLLKHVAGLEIDACSATQKPLVGCRVTFTIAQSDGRRRIGNVALADIIQWKKK